MMKKLYFSLLTFLFLVVAHAQIVNISDANFKTKLLLANPSNQIASTQTAVYNSSTNSWAVSSYNKIDTNNDGEIQVSEAQTIKYLKVNNSNITNLQGIESFTNITFFNCSNNQVTSLNVQGLTNVQTLDCSSNQLPSLNVQDLTNLQYLDCSSNQLPSLNVQGLTNLVILFCAANQLTSLNAQGLTNLLNLFCSSNQLTSLNAQGLTNLQTLFCDFNQLPSLNVQGLTNLERLFCDFNQLSSLDVHELAKLQTLSCSNNQLTALFIKNNNVNWELLTFSNNPNLVYICADEADLTFVQQKVDVLGYTNCQVDSNCSLSVVNNPLEKNYFSIYPNPVKNELNLSAKQATTVYSLSIYNTLGQQVQTTTNPEKTIDVSGLKTGNYIIKVITDKGVSSSKFVKE